MAEPVATLSGAYRYTKTLPYLGNVLRIHRRITRVFGLPGLRGKKIERDCGAKVIRNWRTTAGYYVPGTRPNSDEEYETISE